MSGILAALAGIKTAIATAVDEYFNRTTLLLNTSSTNGAQNNTFLDSSTNNFTITRNGNTTQGTFTPFSQTGWSNYFGATSTYLTVTSQPLINVNDWTVEFWMYPTQFNNNGGIFGASNGGGTNPKLYLYVTGSNLIIEGYSGGFFTALSTAQPTLNQWTYVSVSRSSSTGNAYIYYNGVLQGSAAAVPAITGITGGFSLLSNGEGSSAGFYGYMSNVRVSNVARYTGSSYSVPTAPSTAIANTTLLTAQSNRFVDNSSNGYAIAVTGTPSVQAFSPFAPTAAYSDSVVGGSAYFDGSGDNLVSTIGSVGSGGSFTVEFFAYYTGSLTANQRFFDSNVYNWGAGNLVYRVSGFSLGSGATTVSMNGSSADSSTGVVKLNTWQHHAISYNGTTLSVFVDGVRTITTTPTAGALLTSLAVGSQNITAPELYAGYISNFRFVTGSTVYNPSSTTITVPTSILTAITNTSFLLNATNSGIYDSTAKNVLETVGNAQASTTQAKWGTTSMYFDGTGDWLLVQNGLNIGFNTGNFTVEGWINLSNVTANQTKAIVSGTGTNTFGLRVGQGYLGNVNGLNISKTGVADLEYCAFTFSINTWYHIAVVRSGTTIYFFVDGVQQTTQGSGGGSFSFGSPTQYYVGCNNDTNEPFAGYIDDLRITKGYARYTANFTPPTAAFPLQ